MKQHTRFSVSVKRWLWPLALALLLAAVAAGGAPSLAQAGDRGVAWEAPADSAGCTLTVSGPGDYAQELDFAAGATPVWELLDGAADGVYAYELVCTLPAEVEDDGREGPAVQPPDSLEVVAAGELTVQDNVLLPAAEDEDDSPQAVEDQVIADDLIVDGSLCVGYDCTAEYSFGFDTQVLAENNLRIYFYDTSSIAGFPTNDWRIIANDSASGGANYWAVEDASAGKRPFTIAAGARNNALYVGENDLVGIGTDHPQVNLEIVDGWTPYINMHLDTSQGWADYQWEMGANESNFFIRDKTAGSNLQFRIGPGAPSNSLTIKAGGMVGMGTWSPAYPLEIERTGTDPALALQRTDGATAIMAATADGVQVGSLTDHDLAFVVNSTPVMTLTTGGNLALEGYLTELSDVNAKENLAPVDGQQVLAKLAELDICTWNYHGEESVQHMGPMAQDFAALFGLGPDNRHIAPLDVNGVALAAAQELYRVSQEQAARIAELEAANADLAARLEALEALVSSLAQAQQEH